MSAGAGSNTRPNKDLALLAPRFRRAVERAIAECERENLDAMVYEGYRSQQLQAIYFARGRTVVPPHHTVTNASTNLRSWHGYGLAVDVVHNEHFWEPPGGEGWFRQVAEIFKIHGCKWGGDWTNRDLPHMQWGRCKPSPSDEARRLIREEGIEGVWRAVNALEEPGAALPVGVPEVPPPLQQPQPGIVDRFRTALDIGARPQALAWGRHVSEDFRNKVVEICGPLGARPSDLMACMAFESGETFRPDVRNAAGSGATGLIQFMPATAIGLGTTVQALAGMTAERQLDYVAKYFKPYRGRLRNLGDIYMAILWPAGVGRPDSFALFDRSDTRHPKRYRQNAGLDADRNGIVTRAEACGKVMAKLDKGMLQEHCWPMG
jgi:hypothetical protein